MALELEFPHGLPAFETYTRFRLVESEKQKPLLFLESASASDLSFLLLPILFVDPHYRLWLSPEDSIILEAANTRNLVAFAVITAGENSPPTANLLAPIVVNLKTKRAVQSVRTDDLYSHQFPLIRRDVKEPACS